MKAHGPVLAVGEYQGWATAITGGEETLPRADFWDKGFAEGFDFSDVAKSVVDGTVGGPYRGGSGAITVETEFENIAVGINSVIAVRAAMQAGRGARRGPRLRSATRTVAEKLENLTILVFPRRVRIDRVAIHAGQTIIEVENGDVVAFFEEIIGPIGINENRSWSVDRRAEQ